MKNIFKFICLGCLAIAFVFGVVNLLSEEIVFTGFVTLPLYFVVIVSLVLWLINRKK